MRKGIKKLTAILLAMIMGLSFTYTSYPVYAQENIQPTGTTSEQTENSVAIVGDTYYDDLAEALNKSAESGVTCDLLKDAYITGNHVFNYSGSYDRITFNLNGHTIYGDATLNFQGPSGCNLKGPGIINANIVLDYIHFFAPLTINGNITYRGVTSFTVKGSGILRVNGDVEEFVSGYNFDDVQVFCNGKYPIDSPILPVKNEDDFNEELLPKDLKGFVGQPLSTVSLPQDWSWVNGETVITSGTQTYTARFDTTNYEMEYDFTNVDGYNKDQHYVERELTVTVGEAIAKVVKPDGTEVLYSDIVDAFAQAENSTLYLLDDIEHIKQIGDSEFKPLRPSNNMTLNTNGYTLTSETISRLANQESVDFHIVGNGKDKTAVKITTTIGNLNTTLSNTKIEIHDIHFGSLYVKSDSSVVAINIEDGETPNLSDGANLYLEEGARLTGEFEQPFGSTRIYTNVQPNNSKYKLEVPTNLELGKTYQLDLSEVFLNHSDIVNKGKIDVSISGMDEKGYITMKNGNDIAYLPISIKDIDSLTNDTVILSAEHRNPEKDEAQHYNGNGEDSTLMTIGDKLIKDVLNPNQQEALTNGTYTGTLKIKNNIDDTVKELTVTHEVSHNYKEEWLNDENNHWHECDCGAKTDEDTHTFKWIVDKEATHTEKGSKHEECSVCGYKKASVEIPVLTPTNPEKPNTDKPNTDKPNSDKGSPETGDQTNVGLFTSLSMISALGIAVLTVWKKKEALDNK